MVTNMIPPFSSKICHVPCFLLRWLWSSYMILMELWIRCRFLMEKQIMGEFVRILKVSTTISVALQLLQTLSIMIQNFKSEHSICKAITNGVERVRKSPQQLDFGSNVMLPFLCHVMQIIYSVTNILTT